MIEMEGVIKKFGIHPVIARCSLKIKKGEVVGLLGPNGAGKTTTMRLLVGYLKPNTGSILIDGKNPLQDKISVRAKIGYLPENNPLYEDMKVIEYLTFIGEMKGATQKNIKETIAKTDLSSRLYYNIDTLSRGYKQRVGLAAALVGNPELIILDEPTSGLDPIEQEKIRALIKKLGKDKTVIISTHILSELDCATRLVIINKGSIVYDGAKPKGEGAIKKLFTDKVLQEEV